MKIWKIKKAEVKEILEKKDISFATNTNIRMIKLEQLCANCAKRV